MKNNINENRIDKILQENKYKLTIKQLGFVRDYITTKGNKTLSVENNYNVVNKKTACAVGMENLEKPGIQKTIASILQDNKINNLLQKNIRSGLQATRSTEYQGQVFKSDVEDHKERREWTRLVMELGGAFPQKKIEQKTFQMAVKYERMGEKELEALIRKELTLG